MLLQGKTKEYKNAASNLIHFCGKGSAVVQKKVEVSTTIENSSVFQSRTAWVVNFSILPQLPGAQALWKVHRFSWVSFIGFPEVQIWQEQQNISNTVKQTIVTLSELTMGKSMKLCLSLTKWACEATSSMTHEVYM